MNWIGPDSLVSVVRRSDAFTLAVVNVSTAVGSITDTQPDILHRSRAVEDSAKHATAMANKAARVNRSLGKAARGVSR